MRWRWAPLAARCWREKKDLRNGGALNPRRSPSDADLLLPPDPDGPPVLPPFARAYESAENVASRETGLSSTTMMWVAPRGAHALMRMAVVGRGGFSLDDEAVDVPHVDRR